MKLRVWQAAKCIDHAYADPLLQTPPWFFPCSGYAALMGETLARESLLLLHTFIKVWQL